MKILSLGLSESADNISLQLEQDCPVLKQEGFHVILDTVRRGGYTFLDWSITEGELSFRNYERVKNMLKKYISQFLADTIVVREEKEVLRKIINDNYHYFAEEERGIIYDRAVKLLAGNGLCSEFSPAVRRDEILNKLREYFESHHELVLEGFVTFRLKDYRAKLAAVADKAVDEYMMELEYREFIRVLRYFVDVQETQIEEVHVIIGAGGSFKIRDAFGKIIKNQHLENFVTRNTGDINYEDLLISALITIAPQNIMLHCGLEVKADDVVDTIKGVFEGRVMHCSGCDLCRDDILELLIPKGN